MKNPLNETEIKNIAESVQRNHKNNTLEKLKREAVKAAQAGNWSAAESAIEELFAIALCNEAELIRRIEQ